MILVVLMRRLWRIGITQAGSLGLKNTTTNKWRISNKALSAGWIEAMCERPTSLKDKVCVQAIKSFATKITKSWSMMRTTAPASQCAPSPPSPSQSKQDFTTRIMILLTNSNSIIWWQTTRLASKAISGGMTTMMMMPMAHSSSQRVTPLSIKMRVLQVSSLIKMLEASMPHSSRTLRSTISPSPTASPHKLHSSTRNALKTATLTIKANRNSKITAIALLKPLQSPQASSNLVKYRALE